MKKGIVTTVIAISFFLSAFLTSTVMAGTWGLGVIGTGTHVSASGSETEGGGDTEKTTADEDHNAGMASIFAEYTLGESHGHGFTFGVSFSPMKAQIGARTRADTQTTEDAADTLGGSDDSGTYSAKANVSNLTTLYVEPTLMWNNLGVFLKGGLARIKIESLENINLGEDSSVYPDEWANGLLLGIGLTNRFDSGLFYKLEAVRISYEEISMTSTSGNKNVIAASTDQTSANFAIGYRF